MAPVAPSTRLVVIRGNSGSGKSTIAASLRAGCGRGVAIVGQDNVRRIILREHDRPGASNVGLIDLTVRYALDHGFHVVLEGIMYTTHYGEMLLALRRDLPDRSWWYYLDISFEETLRRHADKPNAHEFGEAEMRVWYRRRDLLPDGIETVLGPDATLEATVTRIISEVGLPPAPR